MKIKAGRIKAESFDRMQYFYRTAHDPLIHCVIRFSGHISESVLKKAVTLSAATIPLIACCFDSTANRPCWIQQGFTGEDIVHVIRNCQNMKEQEESSLASTIDIAHEPQLKIFLINGQEADTLCVLMNHMVCDGTGFKEFLYLLSGLYVKCLNDADYSFGIEMRPRGTGQLFEQFTWTQKLKILFSSYDLSKQKRQVSVPLEGDSCNPFFVTRKISRENMFLIKDHAKSQSATVNDMILTAYIRLLGRKTETDKIVIPCPVDLRRYAHTGWKHGICNLTSNFICEVNLSPNDSFYDTLNKVSGQMRLQKASLSCLKSLILLELIFHALPFGVLQKTFDKMFTIPIVSYSNLGIVDKKLLQFGNVEIVDMYLTGTIKYIPYFQVAISTFDDYGTLSCNLHGTAKDKLWIVNFLEELEKEALL